MKYTQFTYIIGLAAAILFAAGTAFAANGSSQDVYEQSVRRIHLQSKAAPFYSIQAFWMTDRELNFKELAGFSQSWLEIETDLHADLQGSGDIDFLDCARLADLWLHPLDWSSEQ